MYSVDCNLYSFNYWVQMLRSWAHSWQTITWNKVLRDNCNITRNIVVVGHVFVWREETMKLEIKEITRSLCLGSKNIVCLGQEKIIFVASYWTSRIYESCIIQKSGWSVCWLNDSSFETALFSFPLFTAAGCLWKYPGNSGCTMTSVWDADRKHKSICET